ncbi:hypothetical protein JCM3774_005144 [Rhodotorula dairenensis]
MAVQGGSLPILPGVAGLEQALTRRDPARIVAALAQWELRRLWAHKVARAILEEDDRAVVLDDRDLAWLEALAADPNFDEGTIRFCTLDLSWRRLLVERLLRQHDYLAARDAVETFFSSPQAKLHDVMKHEPEAALVHVQTFGRLYEQHLEKVEAVRAHAKRTGERKRKVPWPPKRFKNLVEPDAELLVKMTVDWASCEYRQLRRIDAICLKVSLPRFLFHARAHVKTVIDATRPYSADLSSAASSGQLLHRLLLDQAQSNSQDHSQDSLPTPDPSSDGVDMASASSASRRQRQLNDHEFESTSNPRKRERSSSDEELLVSKAPEAKRLKLDVGTRRGHVHVDQNPPLAVEADPAPRRESLPPSRPVPPRPKFRDSSVQTSPPPEEQPREAPALATSPAAGDTSAMRKPSPRPRTRSPPPVRPAAPPLAALERTGASTAYVGPVLPLSRDDSGQIFSRLQQAAAEQQQRLKSERRQSVTVTDWNLPSAGPEPAAATVAAAPMVDAPMVDADTVMNEPLVSTQGETAAPAVDTDVFVPRPKTLGPTSSAILMPPPPATAAGRGSPAKGDHKAADVSSRPASAPDAVASGEEAGPLRTEVAVATPTSSSASSAAAALVTQDRSTQSSDSVVRDSQEGSSSTQSSKGDISFPTPAQVPRDRSSSGIYSQPGFTATSAATERTEVSLEPPAVAQAGGDNSGGTPRLTDLRPFESGAPFLLEPSSGHVESSLKEFSMGSSTGSASTDEVRSSQAPRSAHFVAASMFSSPFARPSSTSQHRHDKREVSEPPLAYGTVPNDSGRFRASSLPLGARENVLPFTFNEQLRRLPAAQWRVAVSASEALEEAETDKAETLEEGDDLYSASPMTPEELVQQFAEMEEARRSVAPPPPPQETSAATPADVLLAVKTETVIVATAAATSDVSITRDIREDARTDLVLEQKERRRRSTSGAAANNGDLKDDDDFDDDEASLRREKFLRTTLLADEPLSQAVLTQADEESQQREQEQPSPDEPSDQDGAVPARSRSFTNLEDETELSEHEEDQLNKGLEEDMWDYLDLMKGDD